VVIGCKEKVVLVVVPAPQRRHLGQGGQGRVSIETKIEERPVSSRMLVRRLAELSRLAAVEARDIHAVVVDEPELAPGHDQDIAVLKVAMSDSRLRQVGAHLLPLTALRVEVGSVK